MTTTTAHTTREARVDQIVGGADFAEYYGSAGDGEQTHLDDSGLVLQDGEWRLILGQIHECQRHSTPVEVHHGHVLCWRIGDDDGPTVYREQGVREMIAAALPLLDRIAAGHHIEWDGSNHVGQLTPDARKADSDLESLIRSRSHSMVRDIDLGIWDIVDWAHPWDSVEGDWTDAQCEEWAREALDGAQDDIQSGRLYLCGDVDDLIARAIEERDEQAPDDDDEDEDEDEDGHPFA